MSKADEAKRREARLAARLRDNLRRRKANPQPTDGAAQRPQPPPDPSPRD